MFQDFLGTHQPKDLTNDRSLFSTSTRPRLGVLVDANSFCSFSMPTRTPAVPRRLPTSNRPTGKNHPVARNNRKLAANPSGPPASIGLPFAYLGVDPGKSGGVALLTPDGSAFVWKLPQTPKDQFDLFKDILTTSIVNLIPVVCCLEKISSYLPEDRKRIYGILKLKESYGVLRGVITAAGIPYKEVPPATWQKKLGCLTGGDKKITYALAQQLYPKVKITHHVADAILIARYCSLTWN
jgi:hypothetical protein